MVIKRKQKAFFIILGALVLMLSIVRCTKEATNASLISRALVQTPDSTVFSPFYDSTVISQSDSIPGINDVIATTGVLTIIKNNCSSASCHGGSVSPTLTTYAQIAALVIPGNPNGSTLFQLLTTSDLNKAMPPINTGTDLSITEKTKIYNWILNGAEQQPSLIDFRPAAVATISSGCTSANCHSVATIGGEWARRGLVAATTTDTTAFFYENTTTSAISVYSEMQQPLLSTVWNAYKDSVRTFYADTLNNASFRPYKTFSTPVLLSSRRGSLCSYDDIMMDIDFPKALRSESKPVYINPTTLVNYYVMGDPFNSSSTIISRIDSTVLLKNPRTGVWAATADGGMARSDGGLPPSAVALIKAWYFADPNIPNNWKYGLDGSGIFKYAHSQHLITQ